MAKAKIFDCELCSWNTESPQGWKNHMSKSHGGFTREQLKNAGIEESHHDRIKFMSGHKSAQEVRAAAPATEAEAAGSPASPQSAIQRVKRQSKEEQERQALADEFERLRPMLINKWKRRLRIPYSLWARLANDPKVALDEKDAQEGAELHVELMQAMGWIHAGKIEAIADLFLWHGATILSRSELGQHLR